LKEYLAENIRNIGLVGHGSSGKTSLAESILFTAKAIQRQGKVDDGSSTSDYTEEEVRRKISISATLLHVEHKGCKLNIVDMPGFADFCGEVVSGLRVVDTALLVIDALPGPESGSEYVFDQAEKYKTPLAIVVNKIEKEHVSFERTLGKIQEILSPRALPVHLPIGEALNFKGYIDVLKMKAFEYAADGTAKEIPIPGDQQAAAKSAREKVMEAAAEADDALLEKFFEAGELSVEDLDLGLKKAIAKRVLYPILITAATSNKGTSALLDFAISYLPAPNFVDEINILRDGKVAAMKVAEDSGLAVFIFKTVAERHVGELSLFRVYSGHLKPGDEVFNANHNSSEKIGQIFALIGKDRKDMPGVHAGDLGAFVKLKDTRTGDTLCAKANALQLPPIEFPEPTIEFAAVAASKGEEDKISAGLTALSHEDPTFRYEINPELHQTILKGQGELHLDVITKKLKAAYKVDVELAQPKIPYRETITRKGEKQYRYKKQSGGRGQYGDVSLKFEPVPRGGGFEFVDAITGGVIPAKFIPSVEKGVHEAMDQGIVSGNKVVDVKVTLFYGSYHDVDSSDMAFKIAGSICFKNGAVECNPILLEPIYEVEILVPEQYTGDIMGDMSSRRGKIMGMEPAGKYQRVKGQAPLAELYKYSTSLRSMTGGRGRHSQRFSHYDPVPREVADKIIAEYERTRTEEKH
jgi:elongation factor G